MGVAPSLEMALDWPFLAFTGKVINETFRRIGKSKDRCAEPATKEKSQDRLVYQSQKFLPLSFGSEK
jgi:hypothetical protein